MTGAKRSRGEDRLAVALLVLALALPTVLADGGHLTAARLPSARNSSSAIWDGQAAYVFGGSPSGATEIVRYDPVADQVRVMGARLPSLAHMDAFFDGRYAYIVGGIDGTIKKDTILRYDPQADALTTMGARLPFPLGETAAAWTGRYAFLFGGHDQALQLHNEVLRYDPVADKVTTMSARLPVALDRMGAVWTGDAIYVFGGGNHDGASADILRYDPSTDTIARVGQLPERQHHVSAVWDGTYAFLFGGYQEGNGALDQVVVFDPATDSVDVMPTRLPSARGNMGVVWDGAEALLFGGRAGAPSLAFYADIWAYTPMGPNPPRRVEAAPGPALGHIAVTWLAPVHPEAPVITGYRIARGTDPAALTPLADVGPEARSFVDTAPDPLLTSYYRVAALTASGEGPPSAVGCAAPQPANLLPSVQPACSPPAGWSKQTIVQATQTVRVNASWQPLAEVRGQPSPTDARYYQLSGTLAGVRVPVVEVYDAGLLQADTRVVLPNPEPIDTDRVTVRVWAVHDPAHALCLVRVDGACVADSPLDPGEVAWLVGKGAKAEIVVELRAHAVSGDDMVQTLRLPMLGQFWAVGPPAGPGLNV